MTQKRDKFVALAEKRVESAIHTLRLIGNLSNRNNYSYTDKDIDIIFKTLEKELKEAKMRFSTEKRSKNINFKLD